MEEYEEDESDYDYGPEKFCGNLRYHWPHFWTDASYSRWFCSIEDIVAYADSPGQ